LALNARPISQLALPQDRVLHSELLGAKSSKGDGTGGEQWPRSPPCIARLQVLKDDFKNASLHLDSGVCGFIE
jgi:hypothetical protein